MQFVHLHLHTEYSLIDGLNRIDPLLQKAAELEMPALALTDRSNLFAMIKFYKASMAHGIKPIIGVECLVHNETQYGNPGKLVLLCQNRTGYHNLAELISRSFTSGQMRGVPMIQKSWLTGHAHGLIALSGGKDGDIGRALLGDRKDKALQLSQDWQQIFPGRFYIELMRTNRTDEELYIDAAIELATELQLPAVATNDVCFLTADAFEAHEARVCIGEGRVLDDPRRSRHYSDQQYLKSVEEMVELFSDIPEALENTVNIARRCNLELTLGKSFLPEFPIPGKRSTEEYFIEQSRSGLDKRLVFLRETHLLDHDVTVYQERLETELDVIIKMGFPGYFLIVADFIQWAKDNGIPVGPGRGSGAGSLVAYALGITDLDPIFHELLFERFLNPERISMPDFDIDFCVDGRDRVIEYVSQRYGNDKVSQIITYGAMAARGVVRDVARVLGYPYGVGDRIAKLIPFEIGMTLDHALDQEEELAILYRDDEEVTNVIDLAKTLEGLVRNAGRHAGGVVIAPSALTDFTPLYCEEGGGLVTQFDKDDIESVGLVKFDFLGLRTLTIIDWTIDNVEILTGHRIDISHIDNNEEQVFQLLKDCKTTAVFQLESRGIKELVKRLQPDCFEDIVALVALFRPGPLQSGMVDDFIDRKHGKAAVKYLHPDLEPILKPTYGVILYQEQVMQIAQALAGYTLGGADLLRRAMGKKKPEEMAKQRSIFITGASKRGVSSQVATNIFVLMEKFADYGFNKSHSAAYALLSYQTAWLKSKYPAAFMAAVLSADMDNTDKIVELVYECHEMSLEVLPPDINKSQYRFTVYNQTGILYGLGAIKGVGESAIQSLIMERENGLYKSTMDICKRNDMRKLNRRVLEALIQAGALDSLDKNRAGLLANLGTVLQIADQHEYSHTAGQSDMFGLDSEPEQFTSDADQFPVWNDDQRLAAEKRALGLYLTGHPIDQFENDVNQVTTHRLYEIVAMQQQNKTARVAGLIRSVQIRNTRRGKIVNVLLDDRTGRLEVILFNETLKSFSQYLLEDNIIFVEGDMSYDHYTGNMRLTTKVVYTLSQAREQYARYLLLNLSENRTNRSLIQQLLNTLQPYRPGKCPVQFFYSNQEASIPILLNQSWYLTPEDSLLEKLSLLIGRDNVALIY